MEYQKAKNTREKKFSDLMSNQLLAGEGIGSAFAKTLSEKTKARMTGLKEKFDPLNIARVITGGSRLAPAILGKMLGRSPEDLQYFAGSKKRLHGSELDSDTMDSANQILGLIYRSIKRSQEEKKLELELKKSQQEQEQDFDNKRNEELIKALSGRKKKKKPLKKIEEKPELPKRAAVKEKVTQAPAPKAPTKVKPTATTKAPTKVEPSPTTGATARSIKPTAPSAPAVTTATKVGTTAAIVGTAGLLMPTQSVAGVIDKASEMVGVDKALMYAMAKQESGFDPKAGAKTSSAKGLYQFIKGTWKAMVEKYGSKYPILKERGPEDAEANAVAGALFIKENSEYLKKNNIPVNATTVYAAHFLGPFGAKTLLTADPNRDASTLMPQAAKANENIFYEKTGKKVDKSKPRTVKQVIDVLFQKVGQYQQKYAQALDIPSTSGNKIDYASKENKALKLEDVAESAPMVVNNTSVSTTKTSQKVSMVSSDDSSAYEKILRG